MAKVPEINDDTFDKEVIKSALPVLVDFSATWCGPCKVLGPVVEEIADDFVGRLKVVKVVIDSAQETASRLGITSVPTLMVFNKGKEVGRITKQWGGIAREAFSDADTFRVQMDTGATDQAFALMVLATALAIDLDFFEGKGGGELG